MAKTIVQIQAMITSDADLRQIINELADYIQANPSGGTPAIPTLAQVLEAGNSAGNFDIDMNNRTISVINTLEVSQSINLGGSGIVEGAASIEADLFKTNGTDGATGSSATGILNGIVIAVA